METSGRYKRAIDNEEYHESSRAPHRNESISPRISGVQKASSCHKDTPGAESDRGRVTGAVKCRRLGSDSSESPTPLTIKLTAFSGHVSPARQFVGGSGGKAPTESGPHELNVSGAQGQVIHSFEVTKNQGGPAMSTSTGILGCSLKQNSPSVCSSRQDGAIIASEGGPGVLPVGTIEQKNRGSLRVIETTDRRLTVSHCLGRKGLANIDSPVLEALPTPFRVPAAASTTTPISKQAIAKYPFPIVQKRSLELQNIEQNAEPAKGAQTPRQDAKRMRSSSSDPPMPSIEVDDASSDEELIGIPEPDIPDPDISFSQEKLGDLSVTENNLEDTVVLRLCDGLANSLTQAERNRMELLNLYNIVLAQLTSPIVLGRDQFQDVFGDNIRGGMLSHLSRRHCLIHVENVPRGDFSKPGIKVRVEDTSTNGIRVNGRQMQNGQIYELELNDIITLLRIRRDEENVSLEYKLVRSDPQLQNSKRRRNVSRHDGRFVRPCDKFSCDSLDLSNRHGLSPSQKSNEVSLNLAPVQAVAQEMRHQIPIRPTTPAGAGFTSKKKEEMRKMGPSFQIPILSRKIQCTILFADPYTQDHSEASQPIEEANLDYREELSEILSAFTSIRAFDASSYHCATSDTISDALNDDSDVIIYTGGGDTDHLVVEGPNGFSTRLEKNDILQSFSEDLMTQKLMIVIAPTLEPAKLLAECGALHVCFLNSTRKHSLRVSAFIRALFSGLLKGYAIKKCYTLAEFVALNDLLPIVRRAEQICQLLPISNQHNIEIGSQFAEAVATDRDVISSLNAPFIPVLTSHFLGRDVQIRQIKKALAQKVRACNLYGPPGVGKSSIAIHIAKLSYRTRGYRNGVHYVAVDKLVESLDCGSKSSKQIDDPLRKLIDDVGILLRTLPETDPSNYPTTLLVLDGCDIVLPALEVFLMNVLRSFPSVQILLTSTEKVQLDSAENEVLSMEAIHIEELGRLDGAKLFFKLAKDHLTLSQIRQHIPDSSIEAISNDKRILDAKGNPFRIFCLVCNLKTKTADVKDTHI
ncbi:putative forkhead-associated (FHA) domain, SMAD/FHA domain superfamily [Plasmopara halstedii]